jgi:hypothetical protein
MTVNKGSLVSGRVAVTDYANLTADRYQFLGLTQAEPNLGPGANNTVLVITTNNTRSWSNSLTLTGNVSANYFIGNGSQLTGIFTTITNQTFSGDGTTVAFTLQQTATAVSILVTVNGVTQTPDVDYLVISNILTFTTAPANADVIQVRFLSNNSVSGTYSNADVAAFLPTYTGNISAANLSATGNIQGQYVLGNGAFLTGISGGSGNANTGNVTFDNINIIGSGNLHLQPDPANPGSYLDIFLTSGPDLHLVASANANLILGKDAGANVMTSYNGNVYIQSWNGINANTWTFAADGTTTFPNGIEFAQQNQIRATNANNYLEIHGYSPAEGGGEAAVFYGGDAGTTGNSVYTGGSARITGGRGINGGEGGYVRLRTYDANNSSTSLYFYPGGNLELPDAGVLWNNSGLTTLQAGNNGVQIGSNDGQSYVIANVDGTYMQTLADTTNSLWHFGTDGNLTLPGGGMVSDTGADGIGLIVANPPTVIVITGADFVAVNTTYSRSVGDIPPKWTPAGYNPVTDPYILFDNSGWGIWVPGFGQSLYVNTGTINAPLTQWNLNPPLGSVAPTGAYTFNNPAWTFSGAEMQYPVVAYTNLTAVAGGRAFINDGNLVAAGNFGSQVAGGGGNTVPVWSDGTNWYIG